MKGTFPYKKIGDILQFSRGFDITKAQQKDGIYPVVSSSGITSNNEKFKCKGPGIVTGRKGTLGKVFYIEDNFWAHDTTLWVKDFKGNDPKYLYYMLTQVHLEAYDVGASNPTLNRNHIHKLYIQFQGCTIVQKYISKYLSLYDNLIEVNNQRIRLLEETASQIYKEWFVRMRFPGYKEAKFKKGIPAGWEIRKIKELLNRQRFGITYRFEDLKETGNTIVVDQSTEEFMGYHNNRADHDASIQNPMIIFGDHTCKMQLMVEPFSLAENVIPISSKDNTPIYFLFYLIENLVETTEYKRHWNELISKSVLFPKRELQVRFSEIVKPFLSKINILKRQNVHLRQILDKLLPRLISGKLELKENK